MDWTQEDTVNDVRKRHQVLHSSLHSPSFLKLFVSRPCLFCLRQGLLRPSLASNSLVAEDDLWRLLGAGVAGVCHRIRFIQPRGIKPKVLCTLCKRSTCRAASPTPRPHFYLSFVHILSSRGSLTHCGTVTLNQTVKWLVVASQPSLSCNTRKPLYISVWCSSALRP